MGLLQSIRNLFKKGQYRMTQGQLGSVLEHPKISLSKGEYARIMENLTYYQSRFAKLEYLNSEGVKRSRNLHHLPLARTACKKLASLIYNEQAEIVIENEQVNEFVQDILSNDRFNKNFERYLESGLALGGIAMRPYVDGERIRVGFVQAPVFLPLRNNLQDVSECAIVTKTVKQENGTNVYYSLLEFHEWEKNGHYIVTNELYQSRNDGTLGQRVPLSELYEDLEDEVIFKNLSRPLFTYLRTPGMNNKDINSPLGLSIFDNAKTTIDFINRTYDEFMWEVKMGQRRVAVPEHMTQLKVQDEQGNISFRPRFDPEQNVYLQINSGDMDNNRIQNLTTDIRANSYIQSINQGMKLFELQLGVSSGMFTFDGKSMKTATEIVSENSDTYQLRNSIVALVEQAIKELVVSICELAQAVGFYHGVIPELQDISVSLDDGVFTDKNVELNYWTKALASGLVSRRYAISKVLNVTEEEAASMLEEISSETQPELDDQDEELYGSRNRTHR